MPLVHGQAISAAEVEREVAGWDAAAFARLCNAVAWARAWRQSQAMPAFTERVLVADNGIDAQWNGAIVGPVEANAFLAVGTNVFQYKKRDTAAQSRAAIVSTLTSGVRGAVLDVEQRAGIEVANYVLFTNIDLTIEQHENLTAALQDGLGDRHVPVAVVGAAELAAALNDLPHIRSAFFATTAFRSWVDSWEAHRRVTAFPVADLTGRATALNTLQDFIRDNDVRVVAISGTHMMGKSRLALEATRHADVRFVEALDRQSIDIAQIRQLESPGRTVIVLVNDAEPVQARRLSEEAFTRDGLKVIFCFTTTDAVPAPSFGLDTRVRTLPLEPLDEEQSRALLRAAGGALDWSLELWVLENADGVPGVILAAARLGSTLRRDGGGFMQQVAAAFEREARARLSERDQSGLVALSLMSHVGVAREQAREAEIICTHFGFDLNAVLNAVDPLRAAGFIRTDGSFAEVIPPPLANRLAGQAIRGRLEAVNACFQAFDDGPRRRFMRRLLLLSGDEASRFWEEMLGPNGLFTTLDGITENSGLFRFAAAAKGVQAARLLLGGLQLQSIERRLAIADRTRRDLVRATEELLFRLETGEAGIRIFALLAEAENEDWSNNSAGIFKEAFYPLHSQMPLPLLRRMTVLRDLAGPTQSEKVACLALEAASKTVESHVAIMLRRSETATPLGTTPEMMWADVWSYQSDCIDLLAGACQDTRAAVRKTAFSLLPRALLMLINHGHYRRGIPRLEALVGSTVAGSVEVDAAKVADTVMWCLRGLGPESEDADNADQRRAREALIALRERLRTSPFPVRMRIWVGGRALDLDNVQQPTRRSDEAITALAAEACANPEILDGGLVTWLSTGAARAGKFWFELGHQDVDGSFVDRVRAMGRREEGVQGFVTYLLGWCHRDRAAGLTFFRAAAAEDATSPQAVLLGALALDDPDDGAARIVDLISSGRVDPETGVDPLRAPQWLSAVSEQALVNVLEAVAGPDLTRGSQIPEVLSSRDQERPFAPGPLVEFAWRHLEAHPPLPRHLADYWSDHVAARLVRLDPDRAFRLLDGTLRDERDGSRWNPLASVPQLDFWKALTRHDRARALIVVLEAASTISVRWIVLFHLPDLVNLEADAAALEAYAARGEDESMVVCEAIAGGRPGFWPIVFRLIDLHPGSADLRHALERRVERMGQVIRGPMSEHYARCLEDVNEALQTPGLSDNARAWLNNYAARLREAIDEQRRREAHDRVDRG